MKTGSRWSSTTATTEVVVVKAADGVLACAGEPMIEGAGAGDGTAAGTGVQLGKRYADDASGLLVLCVKAGPGPLSIDGVDLVEVATKQLPSSD